MERGHAEALAPMVEEAMRERRLAFAELERLAVTTGPGTFTGQRVGLAFMRGLRVALNLPLIGITTLAAMAQQAMAETDLAHRRRIARCAGATKSIWKSPVTCSARPAVLPFDDAIATSCQ